MVLQSFALCAWIIALENDELTQNVIDRFVVGACKFANPE